MLLVCVSVSVKCECDALGILYIFYRAVLSYFTPPCLFALGTLLIHIDIRRTAFFAQLHKSHTKILYVLTYFVIHIRIECLHVFMNNNSD
jgi:hypothetical protein